MKRDFFHGIKSSINFVLGFVNYAETALTDCLQNDKVGLQSLTIWRIFLQSDRNSRIEVQNSFETLTNRYNGFSCELAQFSSFRQVGSWPKTGTNVKFPTFDLDNHSKVAVQGRFRYRSQSTSKSQPTDLDRLSAHRPNPTLRLVILLFDRLFRFQQKFLWNKLNLAGIGSWISFSCDFCRLPHCQWLVFCFGHWKK